MSDIIRGTKAKNIKKRKEKVKEKKLDEFKEKGRELKSPIWSDDVTHDIFT